MAGAIRNIILTADDFGSCNYIDKGIYQGIDNGVVTCVSAFINFKKRGTKEQGGAYMGSAAALKKLQEKHPHFPIGLHLTINTGTPVSKLNMVPNLIGNRDENGIRHFKPIQKFSAKVHFTPHIVREIGREVRAQIKKFKDTLGRPPNHVSCHFGILFIFKNLLEEILKEEGISGIPVRNPVMLFQTPDREDAKNSRVLKSAKKFFKKSSKMREEGADKAKDWIFDSLDSAMGIITQAPTNKSKLKLLMKNKCHFPDYTVGSLYKREKENWEGGLAKYMGQIPSFIPKFYSLNKGRRGGMVAEFICHLGAGPVPRTSPVGVNHEYFPGRNLELKRLIGARHIFRTNSINLVDFDFLNDDHMA